MSVAERTREAVRADPSLFDALREGVVNYSAAARSLDVDGDEESIATALRRFAAELEPADRPDRRVSVRLHRGVDGDAALSAITPDTENGIDSDGDAAAIEVTGDVDPSALEAVLGRLRTANVEVLSAGATGERLVVAVDRRSGAETLRVVEAALEAP